MSLNASSNVAAAVANYFVDNFTAIQAYGAIPPPGSNTYTSTASSFNEWKNANQDKQFYLIGTGASYKLASVSGNDKLPDGAVPVDLNVAYAIQQKEMTLIDWVMARLADEFRRDSSSAALGKALFATPESNVSFDSSMSQADLFVTLKRLASISNTLRSTLQQGESADRAVAALAISVVAGKLQDAIAQLALFQADAENSNLPERKALKDAQDNLAQLQSSGGTAHQISAAQQAVDDAQKALDAADSFNTVASKALQDLVGSLQGGVAAAITALNQISGGTTATTEGSGAGTLAGTLQLVADALLARLRAAADLVLLAVAAEQIFGQAGINQQTSDGNVLQTAAYAAGAPPNDAVRKVLVELLKDPATLNALVDAIKSNAEALGISGLNDVMQDDLARAMADALIKTLLDDTKVLDQVVAQASDFLTNLNGWLEQEAESATTRNSVASESLA